MSLSNYRRKIIKKCKPPLQTFTQQALPKDALKALLVARLTPPHFSVNAFINKAFRGSANAIKNTVQAMQLVVADFTFTIHHSYILLKERNFSFEGSDKPDDFSKSARLGTYILSQTSKILVRDCHFPVQENNFPLLRSNFLVLENHFPVLEISISCTAEPLSCTAEQFSCTAEQLSCTAEPFSCTAEQLSCTGKPLSCTGKPFSCTGKWFSRSRNLLSCKAFSLFISTLRKNDIKQWNADDADGADLK